MKTSRLRILCADDNPYFRHFVIGFITDYGYEVAEVATASEALSLVRERPKYYDLIIISDWLPDMGGVELFQALRLIPYDGRIVITTPKLSPEQKARYASLGASSFLMVPAGYSEVLRIINPPATKGAGEDRPGQSRDATSDGAPDSSAP